MNYKNIENKNQFLIYKCNCITDLNDFLNFMINEDYKKAVLLTYWIKDYRRMLANEKNFNSLYRPVYKQGTIVEVNLGYNIGSEYGGLHYGIVLNKKDTKNNQVLTILPLSSKTEKTNKYKLDLGNELYNLFELKRSTLENQLQEEKKLVSEELKKLDNERLLQDKLHKVNNELRELDRVKKKICKLKQGSVALVSQITTISKIRISDPISPSDPLYNIIISDTVYKEIENKIQDLFFK